MLSEGKEQLHVCIVREGKLHLQPIDRTQRTQSPHLFPLHSSKCV